jgi:succinate-semialdehyde dehydrogenase/glutarate-semialdehyde dehydrogenase
MSLETPRGFVLSLSDFPEAEHGALQHDRDMSISTEKTDIEGRLLIGGRWEDGAERAAVRSPATGETIGTVAQGTVADVDRAVAAARTAAAEWADVTVFARAAALRRVAQVVETRRDELALILSLEQGKPWKTEAVAEVDSLIQYLELSGAQATALEGMMPPSADPDKRILVYRRPRGVVGAIQPWNFPLETIGIQVVSALACGNATVCVPAPTTSLTAHVAAECFQEAELPPGLLNLVSGPGPVVGDAVAGHPGIDAIYFTGSTVTGNLVAQRAAGKPQVLELGGNGPFVVLDDADLDIAVPAAITSCFYCAGQVCTAAERLLIDAGIYDEFVDRLVATATSEVKLGNPLEESTVMGPLNNEKVASKVDQHVEDARARGAEILLGGSRDEGWATDLYWQPTVVAGVDESMQIATEETFGPVAPLQKIHSEAEALEIMDRSPYGLNSAVFTRDLSRAIRFAERASTGVVVINDFSSYNETHLPFGGAAGKQSGMGRAQGRFPMESALTELRTVILPIR